jgi:hypothetical protein
METIILGSKEIFAIQYKHGQNQKLGCVRFFLRRVPQRDSDGSMHEEKARPTK